jgi:hypothetical protein
MFEDHARDYQIYPTGRTDTNFSLVPKPVLFWDQPITGTQLGSVYVWTERDGWPAVIGTIFALDIKRREGLVIHEFHSLVPQPVTAVWRNKPMGETRRQGLDWMILSDAPPPGRSVAGQQRQARNLARRFAAHFMDPVQGRWELRLLPVPLYKYGREEGGSALAGALFAFCHTRDPEVILALEVRSTGDRLRWHVACASFSEKELHVRSGDAEVWSVARVGGSGQSPVKWCPVLGRLTLGDEVDNER